MNQIFMVSCAIDNNDKKCTVMWTIMSGTGKNHKYLGDPYSIHKCLNVVRMSIFYYIFLYTYFPEIFIELGGML